MPSPNSQQRKPPADERIALDAKAKQIIEELQSDGRKSYAAIGKSVGLSEAAVRQRVARLLEAGAMQIVAVTDPLQLGFSRQAMVGIKVHGDVRAVADELATFDEVDYLVITAGPFDLLAEVVSENDQDLFSLINDRIRTIEAVSDTETFMYMSLRKQQYNWGTR